MSGRSGFGRGGPLAFDDTFDLELPRTASAPARARSALERIAGRVPPERLRDVRLVVSELVTNAVRHAEGEVVRLVVALTAGVLRVEVHDRGAGFAPRTPPSDPLRASGCGLALVEELSDRWGVDGSPRTRVWFEMDA